MAKHDHCDICDYSEQSGSFVSGKWPGQNGKVRKYGDEFRCEPCAASVGETLLALELGEDNE